MRNTLTTATSPTAAVKPATPHLTTYGPTDSRPAACAEPGEPQFVFVTRDGRVMARQADGSVTDITPDQAARRVC